MQEKTPFSFLVWEDASNLPLPEEIREITKDIAWDTYEWHTFGLPIDQAKYAMNGGKTLYQTELPDGQTQVQQMQDFTGRIAFSGYFVDEKQVSGFNWFISMIATIVKGDVLEVSVHQCQRQPVEEYKAAMDDFQIQIRRVINRRNSWWFKWLYRPWFYFIRTFCMVFVTILKILKDAVIWCTQKLTPL